MGTKSDVEMGNHMFSTLFEFDLFVFATSSSLYLFIDCDNYLKVIIDRTPVATQKDFIDLAIMKSQ